MMSVTWIESVWNHLKRPHVLSVGGLGLSLRMVRRQALRRGLHDLHRRRDDPERATTRFEEAPPATAAGLGVAVIVGAGPGLGHALGWRCAEHFTDVVLVRRRTDLLDELIAEIARRLPSARVHTLALDVIDEQQVASAFRRIGADFGTPDLVVYAIEETAPGTALQLSPAAFEACWRGNCWGAFLVGTAAGRRMAEAGHGTLVFIGSTSSIIGRPLHLSQAVGKFGRRALAEVMARELWEQGVHVAHVLIDAEIAEQAPLPTGSRHADPFALADSLLHLHRQPRSAWTFELDLRPSRIAFWQHC